MFGRKYRDLLTRLADMSLAIAKLDARLRELEFAAAAPKDEPEAEKDQGDILERRILEGLENLLSYEGRAGDKG